MKKHGIWMILLLFSMQKINAQCFCESAARKKGNFYAGLRTGYSNYSFGNESLNPDRAIFHSGLRLGTNISDNVSLQTGADLYSFNTLKSEGFYPYSDQVLLDVPIELVFRFPLNNSNITPYFGVAAISKLSLRSKYYSAVQPLAEPEYRKGFAGFYAGLSAGTLILLSENIGLNAGIEIRQNISSPSQNEAAENHIRMAGLFIGFQFHF